jgi:hypothetical protein
MSSYYPFDLYKSTGVEFKYEPKKKTIPNRKIKKELQNNLASKKMTVTPLLQTIMKGKEADTKIKMSKQQGRKPDYEDLLAFHNMSENIEVTYGKTSNGGKQQLDNNKSIKEKIDYGKQKRNGLQSLRLDQNKK